jgi:hypothetical protein
MNDNARKWVTALPDFPQAKGELRSKDGFCCLGVACEIYRRATGQGEWVESNFQGHIYYIFKISESSRHLHYQALPREVQEWLGLSRSLGENWSGASLARMNDTGQSFQSIADFIATEPVGLFVD